MVSADARLREARFSVREVRNTALAWYAPMRTRDAAEMAFSL